MDEPKDLGTLIVVVGKARNLVNKSRFGKQDPFCTVTYGEDKQKTKAIKRGGQHPEWDEELRFTIVEDSDDLLARSQSTTESLASSTNSVSSLNNLDAPGVTTAQALASRSRKGPMVKKGVKSLKLACYADDAKEPELIGECTVLIDEVLKKGEVDEWYDILYKEKYSGEIYLELTFYSNDAPPVKRNVPRPAINNYGGAGAFEAGPSTLPSHHRLSGGISASGSVSGMSLYIPPYVKPTDVNVVPPLQQSSSFQNLGVPPPHRQQTPLPPGQPGYPPQSQTPQPVDNLSVEALSRPLSALSLASNGSLNRPLPSATPTPGQQAHHPHYPHRHSVGGQAEAPWNSLLPQALPQPAPTPHPRPMSTNDALPWDQLKRIEDERRMGGATPVPRPVSGQSYRPPWQSQAEPYRGATPVPGGIPPSLQPAGPPQPPMKEHANSFSGPSSRPFASANLYPSPAQDPIPHPNSAPPQSPANHYNIPTSSFGGMAQTLIDPQRPPTTQLGYAQHQQPQGSVYPPPQQLDYQQQQQYNTRPGNDAYAHRNSLPNPQTYQSSSRENFYPPQGGYHQPAQPSYGSNQQQSTQNNQPQVSDSSSGYVPWYQQTQSPAPSQTPYSSNPTPQPESLPPTSSYGSPPPPVPGRRPIPNPPAPPKNPEGYWYPSDELYKSGQQPQPPVPSASWQQLSSGTIYGQQQSNGYEPPYPAQQSAYQPPSNPAPFSPQPGYGAGPPAPPPKRNSLSWQSAIPPQQEQQSQGYGRTPSPAPPGQSYGRSPSPAPHAFGRSPSPAPPIQQYYHQTPTQPYRAPSPQPYAPQPVHLDQPPQQYHTPNQQLGVPPPSNQPPASSPSPNPPSTARQDWRSYMQNLSTNPSVSNPSMGGIGRTPSPAPPPKDWYTPPPSLPSSIRPPDGWRSTLQEQQNQQWRG